MADEEVNTRIYDLITQLDEKISNLDTQRTSPQAIASALGGRLEDYLSSLVSTLVSKKKQQEAEDKKPRSILRPVLPIDIVSISPGAAASIVAALERAGIGQYDIDIHQKTIDESSSGGGMLDGIIKAFGVVAAWLATLASSLLFALGPWLVGVLLSMRAGFGRVFGSLGRIALVIGSALLAREMFSSNDDSDPDSGYFNSSTSKLTDLKNTAENDPYSLFSSGSESAQLSPTKTPSGVGETSSMSDYLQTDPGKDYANKLSTDSGIASQRQTDSATLDKMGSSDLDQFTPEHLRDGNNPEELSAYRTEFLDELGKVDWSNQKDDNHLSGLNKLIESTGGDQDKSNFIKSQLKGYTDNDNIQRLSPLLKERADNKPLRDITNTKEYLLQELDSAQHVELTNFDDKHFNTPQSDPSKLSPPPPPPLPPLTPVKTEEDPFDPPTGEPTSLDSSDNNLDQLTAVRELIASGKKVDRSILTALGEAIDILSKTPESPTSQPDSPPTMAHSPLPDMIQHHRATA